MDDNPQSSGRWTPYRLAMIGAKGLALTTASCTAALILMSPRSLSAVATDGSGWFGELLAVCMLLMSGIGFADVLVTDIGGRLILPSIPQARRHPFCVGLYALLAGVYLVLTFGAMDPGVPTSWILIADYLMVAAFITAIMVAIARERRSVP